MPTMGQPMGVKHVSPSLDVSSLPLTAASDDRRVNLSRFVPIAINTACSGIEICLRFVSIQGSVFVVQV